MEGEPFGKRHFRELPRIVTAAEGEHVLRLGGALRLSNLHERAVRIVGIQRKVFVCTDDAELHACLQLRERIAEFGEIDLIRVAGEIILRNSADGSDYLCRIVRIVDEQEPDIGIRRCDGESSPAAAVARRPRLFYREIEEPDIVRRAVGRIERCLGGSIGIGIAAAERDRLGFGIDLRGAARDVDTRVLERDRRGVVLFVARNNRELCGCGIERKRTGDRVFARAQVAFERDDVALDRELHLCSRGVRNGDIFCSERSFALERERDFYILDEHGDSDGRVDYLTRDIVIISVCICEVRLRSLLGACGGNFRHIFHIGKRYSGELPGIVTAAEGELVLRLGGARGCGDLLIAAVSARRIQRDLRARLDDAELHACLQLLERIESHGEKHAAVLCDGILRDRADGSGLRRRIVRIVDEQEPDVGIRRRDGEPSPAAAILRRFRLFYRKIKEIRFGRSRLLRNERCFGGLLSVYVGGGISAAERDRFVHMIDRGAAAAAVKRCIEEVERDAFRSADDGIASLTHGKLRLIVFVPFLGDREPVIRSYNSVRNGKPARLLIVGDRYAVVVHGDRYAAVIRDRLAVLFQLHLSRSRSVHDLGGRLLFAAFALAVDIDVLPAA